MKVVIVHYHLGDGGVSRVISHQRAILTRMGLDVLVITGSMCGPAVAPWHRCLDMLNYGVPLSGGDGLLERLDRLVDEYWGRSPDIWHFHNHSLGKNAGLAGCVKILARRGERLLLHIHDLAEDGRPMNAAMLGDSEFLYPSSPRVHYAFLNPRDRDRFLTAGLPTARASCVGNPIEARRVSLRDPQRRLLLAPVRGIRRKNLGELVLLAAMVPDDCEIAVTRAPDNPWARVNHDAWGEFASQLALPIQFAVVDRISPDGRAEKSFSDWLECSSHIVTTSVAEGFGLPGFEAALWERPLIGRALPEIGIQPLGQMYRSIRFPSAWLDGEWLHRFMLADVAALHKAWGRKMDKSDNWKTFRLGDAEGFWDFGNLPEIAQRRVIRHALQHDAMSEIEVNLGQECRRAGAWLADVLQPRDCQLGASAEAANSFEMHGRALASIYRALMDADRHEPLCFLSSKTILDECLKPENFHFLKTLPQSGRFGPYRALISDIYGTLLIAPAGGVKAEPQADPMLRRLLASYGFDPPAEPSVALADAVRRHHAESQHRYPEVDLREIWRQVLKLERGVDLELMMCEIERAWRPARPMPGAGQLLSELAQRRVTLGLLSNAQANTLWDLGGLAAFFEPDLTLLSYRFGIAKPSPELFEMMVEKLASRGVGVSETLFVGNDLYHDIHPAAACGMHTAWLNDASAPLPEGAAVPTIEFRCWDELSRWIALVP